MKNQIFSSVLHPIRKYVFRFSFLTTLNIYKDYLKGRKRLRKCEAKFCLCKLWPETEFAIIHISFEDTIVFIHLTILWPRSFVIFNMWWTEELSSQHLSSWWSSCVLGSAHLLVSHVLGAMHWKREIVTTEQV